MEAQRQADLEDISAVVAAQQQAEYEEEDRHLRAQAMALQESIPDVFQCGICLEEESEEMVARVEPCRHGFCRNCLRDYLQKKLEDHRFPILCPICIAEKVSVNPGSTLLSQNVGSYVF